MHVIPEAEHGGEGTSQSLKSKVSRLVLPQIPALHGGRYTTYVGGKTCDQKSASAHVVWLKSDEASSQ